MVVLRVGLDIFDYSLSFNILQYDKPVFAKLYTCSWFYDWLAKWAKYMLENDNALNNYDSFIQLLFTRVDNVSLTFLDKLVEHAPELGEMGGVSSLRVLMHRVPMDSLRIHLCGPGMFNGSFLIINLLCITIINRWLRKVNIASLHDWK